MSKDEQEQEEVIRRAALAYLARRDHSRQEITQKLIRKQFCPIQIETVISRLIEAELIQEQRFAENYIAYRRNKGYGPLRIRQELQARGINPEEIAELLQIHDNAWFDQALAVWQKHFKGKLPRDFKMRAKQMRFLQYRGFTQAQIESIFN